MSQSNIEIFTQIRFLQSTVSVYIFTYKGEVTTTQHLGEELHNLI